MFNLFFFFNTTYRFYQLESAVLRLFVSQLNSYQYKARFTVSHKKKDDKTFAILLRNINAANGNTKMTAGKGGFIYLSSGPLKVR